MPDLIEVAEDLRTGAGLQFIRDQMNTHWL